MLTNREQEVLNCIFAKYTNDEIAENNVISAEFMTKLAQITNNNFWIIWNRINFYSQRKNSLFFENDFPKVFQVQLLRSLLQKLPEFYPKGLQEF